ncbi:response regulator transcription factor [Falsiphaeobacter marinintestinus]|uniref:response regulator transcription factor n=1 Tax=Falsiphaeobacter marinintestinus TaxID=1492905 RepID=UPI001646C7DE|nr:helix-turn-helix transcriptional regulator [Phaeobacter marinintestinus]
MGNSLNKFSSFVSEMHDRVRSDDAEGLARWAVGELSETLGFDAAWYGWAQINSQGVEIHANAALNLPDTYFDTWQTMSDQDLLAAQILENPDAPAAYSRTGAMQSDGMVFLADTFGFSEIATAMHTRPGRVASFYLSSYRAGHPARAFSTDEQDFLQCAVDQLSSAMKLSASEPGRADAPGSVSIFVNECGIGILGLNNLREQLGAFWPGWEGDELPAKLRSLIAEPGEHILTDRALVVRCENAPGLQGMGLRKLTLRHLTAFDLLTHREREVARTLAAGKSHKEAARILGVAPATIRNQTQAIYSKLGVDNRASMAAKILETQAS